MVKQRLALHESAISRLWRVPARDVAEPPLTDAQFTTPRSRWQGLQAERHFVSCYDSLVTRHSTEALTDAELRALAEFRYRIRRFLRFSEAAAREAGLEPQQHQLLLAAAAATDGPATVGELADRLQLKPHSVDELVTRAEGNGLVRRRRSDGDRRFVLVEPTAKGRRALDRLSGSHREELRAAAHGLVQALDTIRGPLGTEA